MVCKVGPCILRNYNFLKKLSSANSPKNQLSVLRKASPDELLSLVEVCFNIIILKYKLSKSQKKQLATHADYIFKLGKARSASRTQKIIQKGGAFPYASLLFPILLQVGRLLSQ